MDARPRKFVYLDDKSVNEHIASIGSGVAKSKEQTETEEEESTKKFFANLSLKNVGGVGGGKNERTQESETSAVTLDLTAPYRFAMLRDQLEDSDYTIYTKENMSESSQGDVIMVSCEIVPVSYSRLEVALDAKRRVYDDGSLDQNIQDQFSKAENILQQIRTRNSDRFVVKAFDGWTAGIAFDRDQFRQPPTEVFQAERRFILFGRIERELEYLDDVKKEIYENPDMETDLDWTEAWDPLRGSVTAGGEHRKTLETLRETVQNLPGTHPFTEPTGKIPIIGVTKGSFNIVVHPIAVYW